MSKTFDPYHKWLGIPPHDQPPNDYRLLGLSPFEDDETVIENAADARMRHIRTFASGPRGKISQRILAELTSARNRLLDADKRAAYDKKLRAEFVDPKEVEAPPELKALPDDNGFEELESLEALSPVKVSASRRRGPSYRPRKKVGHSFMLFAVVGLVVFGLVLAGGVVGVLWVILNRTSTDGGSREGPEARAPREEFNSGTSTRQNPRTEVEYDDILASIDVPDDVLMGNVSKTSGGDLTTGSDWCVVRIRDSPPIYYELVTEVTRLSGRDGISLGVTYRGRQFAIVIDGFSDQGYRSGLNLVDAHTLVQPRNFTSRQGRLLTNGRPSTIRCLFLRDRLEVYVDDQQIVSYDESPGRLSLRRQLSVAGQGPLFFSTWYSSFRVSRFDVRRLSPSEFISNRPRR